MKNVKISKIKDEIVEIFMDSSSGPYPPSAPKLVLHSSKFQSLWKVKYCLVIVGFPESCC